MPPLSRAISVLIPGTWDVPRALEKLSRIDRQQFAFEREYAHDRFAVRRGVSEMLIQSRAAYIEILRATDKAIVGGAGHRESIAKARRAAVAA